MDYREYWRLREAPFENTRDPRFFFRSADHMEALERLYYLIEDRNMGFGLLSGEIGSGKTLLAAVLATMLAPTDFEVVYLENSNYAFPYLLTEVLQQLNHGQRQQTQYEKYLLVQEFKEFIEHKILATRRHLVLLFDEAQEIAREDLIEVKNLLNMQGANQNYATVILIGQPELRTRVKEIPQLDQRIGLRYHLNALASTDVGRYVEHRLMTAGHPDGRVFGEDTARILYRVTSGVPREINRICKLALDRAFSLEGQEVGNDILLSIVRDLHRQDGLPAARRDRA